MKKVFLRYEHVAIKDPVVKQRLLDLDEYYNHFSPGFDFQSTTTIDSKLAELANADVDWVAVSALGNYLRHGSIDDRVIDECIKAGSPLAGHLLDRTKTNGYYNIDPQFFMLNLKEWVRVGSPSFEPDANRDTFTSVTVLRSEENFHDDYTPYWLRTGKGHQEYTVDRTLFGSRVVRAFLEHCLPLININADVRKHKLYLYPEYYEDQLSKMFTDLSYIPESSSLQPYAEEMKKQFQYEDQHVYILNTEPVLDKLTGPIDHYSGVCGGLKAVAILHKNGFTDNTQVDLFDISQPALDYQQYLVENWDGNFDNYGELFAKYKEANPNIPYAYWSWKPWEEVIDYFLNSAQLNRQEFYDAWQKYRKLKITFTKINLMDHTSVNNYFGSINEVNGNHYVWVSNAYWMEHTMFLYGKSWYDDKLENLKARLREWNGTVWLEDTLVLDRVK